MNVFSELNQANNRNGDLLTEISRLQAENAKLKEQRRAWEQTVRTALTQSDAEPVAWQYRWRVNEGHGWTNWYDLPESRVERFSKLPNYETRAIYTAPPRLDTSAALIEAALTFEPYLADEGFGKERSLKWMVEHFYKQHLPEEKAQDVANRYLAAIRARAADRNIE